MNSYGTITDEQITNALAHQLHQLTELIGQKATQYCHQDLVSMLANNEQLLVAKLIAHLESAGSQYSQELSQLIQIDASFSNLQTGNYGLCSDCDSPIATELLKETPYRQRCRICLCKHLEAPDTISL